MRSIFQQAIDSRLPEEIGRCKADVPGVAAVVNQAQEQLIKAGGETGWWGGWVKTVFKVSRCHPYLTLPRQFARIINLDVCRFPIRIENEFYEMLEAGVGLQDFHRIRNGARDWCGTLEGYERGVWPSTVTLDDENQALAVFITDPRDVGSRIMIGPSYDQNGNPIYSQDGPDQVNGFYLQFVPPPAFATSPMIVSRFDGIAKDATYGDVLLYQVDQTTGAQVLLSRYAASEITPAYRRYYFHRLPCSCCSRFAQQSPCIQPDGAEHHHTLLTALCKFEFVPVNLVTDFLVIGNIPALIEECKAIRYGGIDNPASMQMEATRHAKAIKLLQDEMRHYLGELQPAVNFAPWGTATLERHMIGPML